MKVRRMNGFGLWEHGLIIILFIVHYLVTLRLVKSLGLGKVHHLIVVLNL